MKSFAIVLVCYNRLDGLKRLIRSLENADYDNRNDINLIFSIDNSGSPEVEEYARNYDWPHGPKKIRTFPERQGLKNHILQCGDFTEEYDIVAVFEDDIFVSDSYYHYATQAAEFYWDDDRVAGISLYNFQKNWLNWLLRFEPLKTEYDAYFLKIAQSWGQIWTKNKWRKFKAWYLEHPIFTHVNTIPEYLNTWQDSSWLKYHDRYCIETNRYFVYPYTSLSTNCSDAGEHANRTVNDHQVELQFYKKNYSFCKLDNAVAVYDEYMNPERISEYLGVDSSELVVDFYNTNNLLRKRYLLTTRKQNYKLLKSYSLSLRPIEASILYDIKGDGIYLYDTTETQKKYEHKNSKMFIIEYYLRSHDWRQLLPYAVYTSAVDIISAVKRRTKKYVRKFKHSNKHK